MERMPEYTDGVVELYPISEDTEEDQPEEYIKKSDKMTVWYRELSVFDRTKNELNQGGIEVTMKLRIPQYKKVNSKYIAIVGNEQHKVYNAAHVTSKEGFPETELTLMTPRYKLEVRE